MQNFRIIDEATDMSGTVIIEDGIITEVLQSATHAQGIVIQGDTLLPSGRAPALMPAFVDLHAHFRDSLVYEKETAFPVETLESASMSAAAGGFGTVVCMANTKPAIDSIEKAAAIKSRSDVIGLVDLYPVLSLTKNLEGKELSEITGLLENGNSQKSFVPLMLSDDGKDVADDALFLAAMKEAKRIGIPISCHCDFGGSEAEAAKKAGEHRNVWSRIEENYATKRAIELGKKAGCHIHIAHVSTKEAIETIALAKAELAAAGNGFALTCEVMPHNLSLTENDAEKMGAESWGRVNPPLRRDDDRNALIQAVAEGKIDAIATDHAPHSRGDKEAGAAGFSAFETAFAAAHTELVLGAGAKIDLKRLSSIMSANPARLIGLGDGAKKRGRIAPGYKADLVIVDTGAVWNVDSGGFKTRGKNSPFQGRRFRGKILITLQSGRVVFQAR